MPLNEEFGDLRGLSSAVSVGSGHTDDQEAHAPTLFGVAVQYIACLSMFDPAAALRDPRPRLIGCPEPHQH